MALAVTDNSPGAGSIAWTGLIITKNAVEYAIDNGNSDKRFLWWDADSANTLQETDTFPTLVEDDGDRLVFVNISGIHTTTMQSTTILGDQIKPASVSKIVGTPQVYTPAAAGTATLNLSLGNEHRITMPAGNITIDISNAVNGQKFMVSLTQDAVGSRTATWFTTIKWGDNIVPTLTTTASKKDIMGFIVTGTDTYDGTIIGQNY